MAASRPRTAKATEAHAGRRAIRRPLGTADDFEVVGIGASAGGLDACRRLLATLPADMGMAFILVQHLDPTHESMMVELLAAHTSMPVVQATNGMLIERDHLYVIPPGAYLSVGNRALHLSQPQERHGARLPFDFLLHSLATGYGGRAVGVVLSGTGADGSLGLKAVKASGGLVIVQDPDEASYDGMPRSAIQTGAVDLVLPVAKISQALVKYRQKAASTRAHADAAPQSVALDYLSAIIALLRSKTAHDFTLYKPGTLQRRIAQRMSRVGIAPHDMDRYLDILRNDAKELEFLANDLLINVTSFFRDPKVFDYLAATIIPEIIHSRSPELPLRIWVAGCSTGEEAYSLAILFREGIAAAKLDIKFQIFASDVDPDAIAKAREGLYPEAINADVSADRLARFFLKDNGGYRVSPEIRTAVVFTVQDLLVDPPFSRLDMIACRNLLIYLRPEAQAKAISVFHFALREGGILLLGNSETVGNDDGRFAAISKPTRLFRHIGRSRPGELAFSISPTDGVRIPARPGQGAAISRQAALADLCKQLVAENYAPASVLIDNKHECLYSLGPTELYLHVAPGRPTHDLLAMVSDGLRIKLRAAIHQAGEKKTRIAVPGGRTKRSGGQALFKIAVQPVVSNGEELFFISFIDEPQHAHQQGTQAAPTNVARVVELEEELKATRVELQGAIRNLEVASEEQKAITEDALSINEEYQSTNEELLTSKEELQSLNEELTALNSQLQETLERQRTTSNDLQNVLYSTDVATLFLDVEMNIRFFTPATKMLFNLIPNDIGRPLADFSSLASDGVLLADARTVLQTLAPLDREIEAQNGTWFMRRILPYRTQDNAVQGVVITFTDITERKRAAQALEDAKRQADMANAAKSRFLAAASHDLRQPLQTLALLQGMLAMTVEGERAQTLVKRLDETLAAISGMLNALLDINQIDAGNVSAKVVCFPINDLFSRLRDEFTYHAQAQGLSLRVVPCGLSIESDPRLLEQMIRNLLSNALKYTKHGKVLLGCRRHAGTLSIEIWDTGIGIPDSELQKIFEEYHQLNNAARERARGLGLGLSIVERLSDLLGHRIHVRSRPGKGSAFAIEIELGAGEAASHPEHNGHGADAAIAASAHHTGNILIVEDDPEVRELMELLLKSEGHRVATAPDGSSALELVARGTINPDLVLADYNLPGGMDGLQMARKLRERFRTTLPVIMLTGDISTSTLRDIALQNCTQLNKPVKPSELTLLLQTLLTTSTTTVQVSPPPKESVGLTTTPVVFVIDDDNHVREAIRTVLEDDGLTVEDFSSCEAFLAAYRRGGEACLVIDAYLPGMNGIELLQRMKDERYQLPSIMITGSSDVSTAVQAMKAGASDFVEKPINRADLLAGVRRALEQSRDSRKLVAWRQTAADHLAALTSRQRQIMDMVLAGHPSKNIAADLGISQRTVETHRASIMKKTGARSLPALARLALAAASNAADEEAAGDSSSVGHTLNLAR